MFTPTVSSKGQRTLPAELRQQLGIDTGAKLPLTIEEDRTARLCKARPLQILFGSIAGIGHEFGRPIEQADGEGAIPIMSGLDTNVVPRGMPHDDLDLVERIRTRAESGAIDDGAVVNPVALAEAARVLARQTERTKADIVPLIDILLKTDGIVLLNENAIRSAVATYRHATCDFSDCLIAERNAEAGARPTLRFDTDALTLPGFAPFPA